jgi:hypothetical protein
VESSYAGGKSLKLTGAGFSKFAVNNSVKICDSDCTVTTALFSSISCLLPEISTRGLRMLYSPSRVPYRLTNFKVQSDNNNANPASSFDGNILTGYARTVTTSCYMEVEFGY